MPELPEVETVVRDLRPQLSGRKIASAQLTRDPLISGRLIRYPSPPTFVRRLRGRTIKTVERRGKDRVMPLDPGGERLGGDPGMARHLRGWEPGVGAVQDTTLPSVA